MKPASLNDRIRQDIEDRIMSGVWQAGQRIPPEHELMGEYSCSRMTVSKAISALAERGLIDRRKRAGSFVAAPTSHRAILDIPDIAAEIEERGDRHTFEILERTEREANATDRALLTMPAGPVMSLTCLHRSNGRPFVLEERLINVKTVPTVLDVDFSEESPGRWLLGHVPWTDAKHRIAATIASGALADHLGLSDGAACLTIERWTWRTEERITYVKQLYPGDHALTAHFTA